MAGFSYGNKSGGEWWGDNGCGYAIECYPSHDDDERSEEEDQGCAGTILG